MNIRNHEEARRSQSSLKSVVSPDISISYSKPQSSEKRSRIEPQTIVIKSKNTLQTENIPLEIETELLKGVSTNSGTSCATLQKNISSPERECLLHREISNHSNLQTYPTPASTNIFLIDGMINAPFSERQEEGSSSMSSNPFLLKVASTPQDRVSEQNTKVQPRYPSLQLIDEHLNHENHAIEEDSASESSPSRQRYARPTEESKTNIENPQPGTKLPSPTNKIDKRPREENLERNDNLDIIQMTESDRINQVSPANQPNPINIPQTESAANPIQPSPAPDTTTEAPHSYLYLGKPEMRIFLYKATGFFFSAALASLFLRLNLPFDVMYFLLVVLMAVHVMVDIIWKYKVVQELLINSEDLYRTFDGILTGFSFLFLYLRYVGVMKFSELMACPYAAAMGAYLSNESLSTKRKVIGVITRCFYIAQALLIALKYDGYILCDWIYMLITAWVYLAIVIFQQVKLIVFVIKKMKQLQRNPIPGQTQLYTRTKIIGLTWYICCAGSAIMAFIGLFAIADMLNHNTNSEFKNTFTTICIIVFSILSIVTLPLRNRLISFLLTYNVVESYLVTYYSSLPRAPVRKIDFEVENKESFFVMISSTYFQPLHKSFLTKEKETRDKIKNMLGKLKLRKQSLELQAPRKTDNKKERINIDVLRQDKDNLDKIIPKIEAIKQSPGRSEKRFSGPAHNASVMLTKEDRETTPGNDIDSLFVRPTLSLQNHRDIVKFYGNEAPQEQDEAQCYLCCVNPANAIIIGCGHGGICHDCAITSVKKKDQCMECRAAVEGIYKIDPNLRLTNIVKGTQISKVTVQVV